MYNAHIRLQGKAYCVEYFFHKLSIMKHIIVTGKIVMWWNGEKHTLRYAAQNVVYLAFMCFVWVSEQTAIISLYNINTFTAIVDLSRSNFSIARAPLFQLKSAT